MRRLQQVALAVAVALYALTAAAACLAAEETPDEIIDSIWQEQFNEGETPSAAAASGGGLKGWLKRTGITGYIKNETAYRFHEPRSITKIRNILYLQGEPTLTENLGLRMAAWAYHDHAYDLFDYQTISARSVRDEAQPLVFIENLGEQKDSDVAAFRELYLDYTGDRLDLRLGKQYIIWGVMEGLRIVDEVNPQDFRELVLPDLLDYRIPLWSARADYYGERFEWELIWIPELKFHEPAPPGSEWEMLQSVPNTSYPDQGDLQNSEFGFRVKHDLWGGQASLSYFYTWDDFPVIFRKINMDSAIEPFFYPTFTRINMFGATYVKSLDRGILKFEGAYVPDKYFGVANTTDLDGDGWLDNDGEVRTDHLRWALGYEFNYRGMDIAPAISQWIINNYQKEMIQSQYDTSLTLYLRKVFPARSTVFQLLVINLASMSEVYLKPELIFDVSDFFQVTVGLDLFYGRKSTLGVSASGGAIASLNSVEQQAQFFGNFHDNDRFFAEFKYSF